MLKIFNIQQSDEWDCIVKSFKEYDVYWLSGYVKAFMLHGDGEPLLFFYEDDKCRGINVVMKRDISSDRHFINILDKGRYFDFSSPYGYGGWIIEGTDYKGLFADYNKWCCSNNIVSEFIRFHPVIGNQKFAVDTYDVVPLGLTVSLDITSPEIIWENITSKNRNMIRKAQKNEIVIKNDSDISIYREFMKIYNLTMDKDNADEYYYFKSDFYDSICYDLNDNAKVFYAIMGEKIIAASIIIFANGKMNYHLSGSLREFSTYAPTNLLLYEVAMWGCSQGYTSFYLGGGVGSGEDSLYKFKKSFYRNDDTPRFHIGKKIFCEDIYFDLLNKRELTSEGSFFPYYRVR